MITLQELITRGRFLMADAPSRLQVFDAVDGRRSLMDIAAFTQRHPNNVRRDLTILRDAGLVQQLATRRGVIFEKVALARTIPLRYFAASGKRPRTATDAETGKGARTSNRRSQLLVVPSEIELLQIAKDGESQLHEFKAPGAGADKLAKEIAAMLNTSQGGMILYGVEDDGTIVGSDVSRQKMDQPLQNTILNSIAPAATVTLHTVSALGSDVIVVVVPPWNRRDVYQFQGKILLRKGTNVFGAKPEEVKQLHAGRSVV